MRLYQSKEPMLQAPVPHTPSIDEMMVGKPMVIVREFNAPRERLFRAWVEPDLLCQWWGPHQFTNPVCRVDPRPGGAFHIVMRGPDGMEYPYGGILDDYDPPRRLVLAGKIDDGRSEGVFEQLTTVNFLDEGGQTRLVVETSAIKAAPEARPMLEGMSEGWKQSLERLESLLLQPWPEHENHHDHDVHYENEAPK